MKTLILLSAAVLSAAGVLTFATAQDKPAPGTKPPTGQAEMMAKWSAFSTPGEAHERLAKLAGKWNLDVKMTDPEMPASTSEATSECRMIMDDRYLEETVHGTFADMPFEGFGLTGYDNLKEKYCGTWVDNMSTGFMSSEGTYDAATKTFTYVTDCPDVVAGKYIKARMVMKQIDDDRWMMQAFKPGAGGKEVMTMQIDYERAR